MRLLRWLFHPVNLLILIVLIALFINRQSLFPELAESEEVKQLIDRVDNVVERISESATQELDIAEAEQSTEVMEAEKAPDEDRNIPEMKALDDALPVREDTDASEPLAVSPALGEVAVAEPNPQTEPEPEQLQAMTEVTATGDTAEQEQATGEQTGTDAMQGKSPLALWEAARIAAWRGEPLRAIDAYRGLIELQPDNYDAYGEMGNVYFQMGRYEDAVDAYAEAALRLNSAGQPQQAWQVLGIISRLDQARAHELYLQMRDEQLSNARQP